MYNKVLFILMTTVSLFAANANGAPMAYSVNSDGQDSTTWDSLYLIDLAAGGSEQRRGQLYSGPFSHFDTEGLAFSPDGTLWGVDDSSRILFPINILTGAINYQDVIFLPAIPTGGRNDFGMTFACDNTLYLTIVGDIDDETDVTAQTLYRVDETGASTVVGNFGALGENISAIAAIGNPTRLYGLGNGLIKRPNGTYEKDAPNLYRISTDTGVATLVGPLINAADYIQAGLSFDGDGNLWAITDRSAVPDDQQQIVNLPSQVLSINVETGEATVVRETTEIGFESLAISAPLNCEQARVDVNEYPRIPTLGPIGLLGMAIGMLLAGLLILRRRAS